MNETEEKFVKTFIVRDRRDRWLSFLTSAKNRDKVTCRLAHVLEEDLDPRFVYDKENPPPEIAAQVKKTLGEWRKVNPEQVCHIISNSSKDGETMRLSEAETDYDLTVGSILVLIPDKLAYYHPERDNLSRQPYKLLFHP